MSADTDPKTLGNETDSDDELKGSEAPLVEHLAELRKRLIYTVIAIAILFVGCFFFADQIYNFLLGPFIAAAGTPEAVRLIYTAPQEFFFTKLSVALFAAIFLAFPVIATQIYGFVAPGLYKNERMAFLPYLIATPICFLIGAGVVYYGVMPLALGFFLGMQQVDPGGVSIEMVTRVSEYLSLIMTLLLAFGICFQMPVILTLLAQVGLIGEEHLKKWRKYAIVAVIALAAFLTPPDPISQIGLALPLLLLYELSIIAVRHVEKRRLAKEAALQKDLES
ncbi:twin-arginine translocase subunit TatC [Pelagibacterium lentulum]|uniref:Sec-independent protein translocase protein TatC n=1 Tax=Pelagibacterium lentulum TaxID=2029865 RepID=A0A916RDT0_9HYPH|nr:twin-arginine translocase subunit TatC [Pelagibacterium lentulum]GGA53305.1 Sec-independent protein translocase protein TatC [Pelagibacterium lentulum]